MKSIHIATIMSIKLKNPVFFAAKQQSCPLDHLSRFVGFLSPVSFFRLRGGRSVGFRIVERIFRFSSGRSAGLPVERRIFRSRGGLSVVGDCS